MFGFADQTFKQCQQPPVQPATFFLNFFWGCKFFPSLWNFRMIVTSCPIVQHKNSNENWLWNSWNLHCYLSLRSLIYYGEKCDWNYIYIYIWMQNEVIKPTINGLLDIMKACEKAKTVRRLVFTSSAGTVDVTEHPKPVIDETCWSDVEFCRRVKMTGWVS